ncbi:hypothetical protein [Paenibacillus glycinis]|uniref:Amino acid transporter n=1 Tax=Paenibacillus glycinis TaxID=2697035 RepID=A0ABW9XPF4_9BACL|nr:hypothetical protein [Paenibacillus glycinis]NBD24510.1 hypothetical protein [Paenibacillus glycinis]
MADDHEHQRRNEEHRQPAGNTFNDVTEHNRTIMGVPDKPVDLGSMPKPLRIFGYFFLGAFALFAAVLVVTLIVQVWG